MPTSGTWEKAESAGKLGDAVIELTVLYGCPERLDLQSEVRANGCHWDRGSKHGY